MKRIALALVALLLLESCDGASVLTGVGEPSGSSGAGAATAEIQAPLLNPKTGERPVATQITWGRPDGTRHPNVGVIIFDWETLCTGTLIAPTVVLTAAHCLVGVTNETEVLVSFDEDVKNLSTIYVAESVLAHPMSATHSQDVGLVFLEEPAAATPAKLPEGDIFDALSTQGGRQNRRFTLVGYGVNSMVPVESWELSRHFGESTFVEARSLFGKYNFVRMTNSPGRGNGVGGVCFGDSGGPAFWGDTDIVAAITSWGPSTTCTGGDYMYRVDTRLALEWIAANLP